MAKPMSIAQRTAWAARVKEILAQRQVKGPQVRVSSNEAIRRRIMELTQTRKDVKPRAIKQVVMRPRAAAPRPEPPPVAPPPSAPSKQRKPASEAVITVDPIETQGTQYETALSEAEEKSLRDAEFHGLTTAKDFNESDGDYGDLESELGLEEF